MRLFVEGDLEEPDASVDSFEPRRKSKRPKSAKLEYVLDIFDATGAALAGESSGEGAVAGGGSIVNVGSDGRLVGFGGVTGGRVGSRLAEARGMLGRLGGSKLRPSEYEGLHAEGGERDWSDMRLVCERSDKKCASSKGS